MTRFTSRRWAAAAAAAIALIGIGVSPAHAIRYADNQRKSVTISNGSSYVVVDIYYDVAKAYVPVEFGPRVEIKIHKFVWNTSPSQKLDALCLDYEGETNQYTGNFCVGAPSSTYDDVNASGTQNVDILAIISNETPPTFRVRAYGLANQHTRKDGFVAM